MKLAIPILVLFLALGIYFGMRSGSKILETEIATEPVSRASISSQRESPFATKSIKHVQESIASDANSNHEEIESQIQSLVEASAKSDSDSFQIIVHALNDKRAEVRQAALDAAIQFGSRDVIPFLKEAAEQTADAREKVEILDAIEFLELPSFSEIKQTRNTNSPAKP